MHIHPAAVSQRVIRWHVASLEVAPQSSERNSQISGNENPSLNNGMDFLLQSLPLSGRHVDDLQMQTSATT